MRAVGRQARGRRARRGRAWVSVARHEGGQERGTREAKSETPRGGRCTSAATQKRGTWESRGATGGERGTWESSGATGGERGTWESRGATGGASRSDLFELFALGGRAAVDHLIEVELLLGALHNPLLNCRAVPSSADQRRSESISAERRAESSRKREPRGVRRSAAFGARRSARAWPTRRARHTRSWQGEDMVPARRPSPVPLVTSR